MPSVDDGSALAYEAILSALLMFVIMAVATDTRAVGAAAAIAIGGAVGWMPSSAAVTGASMNPARSLGPRSPRASGPLWIYLVGPVVGRPSERWRTLNSLGKRRTCGPRTKVAQESVLPCKSRAPGESPGCHPFHR